MDEYFKRITKSKKINLDKLEEKKVIKQCLDGTSAMFWFNYFGVNILFKAMDDNYNIASELISEELAIYLGLKNAQYDLATFNGRKGLITYDFRKSNCKYISLYDVHKLYFSYADNINNDNHDIKLNDYRMIDKTDYITNLEDTWNVLEWYLNLIIEKNKEDIPKIIENLMLQLTDYFSFQMISGNYDMHSGNIMLEIKEDYSDVSLTPLYDNEDMFKRSGKISYKRPNTPKLSVSRENIHYETNYYDILEEYLKKSDITFINRFKNTFNKITEETI